MANYQVTTEFVHKIVNEDQLESWKTKKSTLLPFQLPGHTERVKQNQVEIDDIENSEDDSSGLLHKCPRRPCVSQFIKPERLEAHLKAGICKIYAPATKETINERVTVMYISAFGTTFHENFNTKQKLAKDMVLHLEDLPSVEVDPSRVLERADTPLAKLSQSFQDIFKTGFALLRTKEKSRFSEAQLEYILEIFEQGRNSRHTRPLQAEQWMKEATLTDEEGNVQPRFEPEDWLTEDQIKYLFSKFAADIRKGRKTEKTVEEVLVQQSEDLSEAEKEAKSIEDDENENYLDAAHDAALLGDIRLEVLGDSDEQKHPLEVCDIFLYMLSPILYILDL